MSFTRDTDPASIASTREDIRLIKQYMIVWFTVLLWDTLATFPSEYKYIWKAKWTPLKIAFLINRYWTIGAQASTAFLLLAPLSPNVCRKIFWGFATDGISIMFFCDCIVAIRVYAVYEKSRKILYVLVAMLVTDLGLMIGAATQLRPVIYTPELREALDFKGCAAAIPVSKYSNLISILYWSPPLLFNAIALGLILHRNIELSKQAGKVPILQRMLRDGLFFFLVIMASNLVNVVLVAQSNPAIHNLNIPASLTLTSLMCSRLVLSLHQHNTDVRRSQANYGNSFVTSNPGPTSVARPSIVSLRTRARQPSRPGLEEYLAALGPTEHEHEDDDGESRDSPTTAVEEGSRESLNDKFRYTVQFDPTVAADPVSISTDPAHEVERIDEMIARRPPTRQGRRESVVSFVSAHSMV